MSRILSQRAPGRGPPAAEKKVWKTILSHQKPAVRPAPAGGGGRPEAWSVVKASAVLYAGALDRDSG